MNVTLTPSTDGKTATLAWTPPAGQEGFVATIDGVEQSIDGKRHFSASKTTGTMKVGLLQDGKSHLYGVNILGVLDSGAQAYPAVSPPPPPTGVPTNIYVDPSAGNANYSAEWDAIVASGLKLTAGIMAPMDATVVKHVGVKGQWVLIYNGASQSTFQQYAVPCWQTGLVAGFVVWDEPGSDAGSIAQVKNVASWVHASCPGALTATTGYSPSTLQVLAQNKVTDLYFMDSYPSRSDNWTLSNEKACVAALEAQGARYGIVLDAFSAPNYPIPTAAQLQSEIDWARSTKAELLSIYAWGITGGTPHLQDDAELMAVLKGL